MNIKIISVILATAASIAFTLAGCTYNNNNKSEGEGNQVTEQLPEIQTPDPPPEVEPPTVEFPEEPPSDEQPPQEPLPEVEPPVVPEPKIQTVSYIKVTANNVNIRTGAGTGYGIAGTAERNTLYANLGEVDGFYKTQYKISP